MTSSISIPPAPLPIQSAADAPTWDGLKRAIMASSGFQSWCLESARTLTDPVYGNDQHDQLVMAYLRETLETLAY